MGMPKSVHISAIRECRILVWYSLSSCWTRSWKGFSSGNDIDSSLRGVCEAGHLSNECHEMRAKAGRTPWKDCLKTALRGRWSRFQSKFPSAQFPPSGRKEAHQFDIPTPQCLPRPASGSLLFQTTTELPADLLDNGSLSFSMVSSEGG